MRFWHYTVGPFYKGILESGYIKPATKNISEGEVPVVWFSTNTSFEETARRSITNGKTGERFEGLSRDALFEHGMDPVRIEVDQNDVELYQWKESWEMLKITQKLAVGLEQVALKDGADPQDWWFTFTPVPMMKFKSVEAWNGKEWKDISESLKLG